MALAYNVKWNNVITCFQLKSLQCTALSPNSTVLVGEAGQLGDFLSNHQPGYGFYEEC